jgi:predicted nucleotidyltransferase
MVGVTGGLAMKNATVKSDWDLLIVIKSGKIWTGRTLVTILTQLLGKRRYGKKIVDRVCLNFFVTDQSLEVITKDLFSASEYMFLFPLYGWQIYLRFQMKNHWIKNMKPHYGLSEIEPLKTLEDSAWSAGLRGLGEKIFAPIWIEKFLRTIEKKRIMQNPNTQKDGSLVYASDDALIFLPSPHGPKIFEQFKEKVNQLSV